MQDNPMNIFDQAKRLQEPGRNQGDRREGFAAHPKPGLVARTREWS